MMRPLCRTLTLVLVLAAFALPARAQSLAERLDEARLATQVQVVLAEDAELRAFTFAPSVRGRVLTLAGRVETAEQRERAAAVAQGIEGIESVVNRVGVGGDATAITRSDLPPVPDTVEAAGEDAVLPEEAPEPEPEPVYHTVQSGDVLGAVARRYGVTVRQIQQLNGLSGTRIRVGQRLRVE